MPAYKVQLSNGATYWVGRDAAQHVAVHDPLRQAMDFGMIRLYVVGHFGEPMVDRAWPVIFNSEAMHEGETVEAVLEYLVSLNKRVSSEISGLTEVLMGFVGCSRFFICQPMAGISAQIDRNKDLAVAALNQQRHRLV
jgi:hypothetical protein